MASPMLRRVHSGSRRPSAAASATAARQAAVDAYAGGVAPAYRRLLAFLESEYIPRTRETIAAARPARRRGLVRLQGPPVHDHRPRRRGEIHDIGLAEVERIRAEMDEVIAPTGFDGLLRATSWTSCAPTRGSSSTRPEDLLVAYRDICKRVDPELPRLFGTLPRLPYGVVPVPAYAEKSQTTAYYEPGSPAAGRPGNFFANTYDLKARPRGRWRR